MQIRPRYEGPAVLCLDVPIGDPSIPLLRQRRRLADILTTFDHDRWSAPSRCDGWSSQDVVSHLTGTNQFWALSLAAGLSGEPTRVLEGFDPVATPARMVDALRTLEPEAVLSRYIGSLEALAATVTGLGDDAWLRIAEAPPGHVALNVVVMHALWDSWVHERDIVIPLGIAPIEEADEVTCSLLYAAAIGPALRAAGGSCRRGSLSVDATEPDVRFVVDVGTTVVVHGGAPPPGAACLSGRAVELAEGLSRRAPLPRRVDEADAWLVAGLAEAFDAA